MTVKLNLRFIFTGRTKEKYYIEEINKYKKILSKYGNVDIVELKSVKSSNSIDSVKIKESANIEKALRRDAYKIFLDLRGKNFTTELLSHKFSELIDYSHNKFDFVVGGAYGVDAQILKKGDLIWKLSDLTFNHQMVRIILLEQVYRILSIINGEKYHH